MPRWSGWEVRALREAKRMSLRAFAAHLGVSDRMISKWEAGGETIHPRPVNQAALDTSLAQSDPDVQARFALLIGDVAILKPAEQAETGASNNQLRHPVDGKLMTLVHAGIFLAGANNEPVWLPAFYIDVYPTTNADYARFIAATDHRPPLHWADGRCPDEPQDHPVVFVTWHDADTYATWAGKSLPSSHQWEKAARGTRGNVYPWGNQPTPAKCNVRDNGPGTTTPGNCYRSGVSPYGVYDLCGNVWEWCATETEPGRHELKGSAFTSPFDRARPSAFNDASAKMRDDDTGFRCVSLPEALENTRQRTSSQEQTRTDATA
ncbi:MAG: SUMF1/EgtB/PvdO family nonheme iron enzyme [Nocardiopsaceae bacterium]|nr:SUMF1/EgtB/PvdO family nonheme iron enzyme [Nocardiopsaceae bacterium]